MVKLPLVTPRVVPPGWPPVVTSGAVITAGHINAISQSGWEWPGHVDARGFNLINTGNVGIGTASPAAKLDVRGEIWAHPTVAFRDLASGADQKLWKVYSLDNALECTCANDADSAANTWMKVERSSYIPTHVRINTMLSVKHGATHDTFPAADTWAGEFINYQNAAGAGGLIVAGTWAANDTGVFMVGGVNGVWPGGFASFFAVWGAGYISMHKLPTSAAGLPSGYLWRDAAAGNVIKIVP